MNLEELVIRAAGMQASDLHLEPGLPAAFRVRGELRSVGEPLDLNQVRGLVREAVGEEGWQSFRSQRSYDVARLIDGVRCRINALYSMRGVGLALRLLPAVIPTLQSLNLHPELGRLVQEPHGLILVSGPTGCGKSSTLAALLQELNLTRACHLLTIEQPIEYALRPQKAFIRQREVGRDTPSFEQALLDAMREDPDVIMVGEMREPECMRLTLNAAETGHLVLATVHSSDVSEALTRMVLAFPAEIQSGISAQLADCLRAVVCQRLRYREDLDLRLPECQILTATSAARACIRQQQNFKLGSVMETGAADGMWTWERYRDWQEKKTDWNRPSDVRELPENLPPPREESSYRPPRKKQRRSPAASDSMMEIDQPAGELTEILAELEKKS